MERNFDLLLIDLLRRWHGWASSPVRPEDTLLRDFDALVSTLPPRQLAAAATMARNAHAGVRVWSSPRVDESSARRAKARLLAALRADEARWFGKRKVLLNERGNRVGESNPMAECKDRDVELALELYEERGEDGRRKYGYGAIARMLEVHKATVQGWVNARRRAQLPARVKEV